MKAAPEGVAMNEPYLPTWATSDEACEWLEFKTGQKWSLPRICEAQPKAGFHLVPAPDTDDETMLKMFNGQRGGIMVALQPEDIGMLAASRGELRVYMVGLPDGTCVLSDKPIALPLDGVRFFRESLEKITHRMSEGAQFNKPPRPLTLRLEGGMHMTLPNYGTELNGLPVSVELVNFVPMSSAKAATPSPAPAKPLPRAAAQDAAILAAIQQSGHDPLSLPKGPSGKPGVKAAIRAMLVGANPLFQGEVFDKAWERLRKHGEIADGD